MVDTPLQPGQIIPQCGTTIDLILRNDEWVSVGGEPVSFVGRHYVESFSEVGGLQRVRLSLAAGDRVTLPVGWRPMETAPEDGTPVVLVGLRRSDPERIVALLTRWYADERKSPAYLRGWCWSSPGLSDAFDPIAWMPSPVDVDEYFRPIAESKDGDQ